MRQTKNRFRPAALVLAAAVSIAAPLTATGVMHAQTPILLQGIADAELWSTSATSNLLTRNAGRPGGVGRLQLWGAVEPVRGLVFYAQGLGEFGSARTEAETYDIYSNQFGIRYSASRAAVVDVGRLTPIIGAFAARRFSTRNPLIGLPDGYSLDYPMGAMVSGESEHFDYRVAAVSLPADHAIYVPSPTPKLRPAIGGGYTPFVGLRIGASATIGPYLNDAYTSAQLGGKAWTSFQQRVVAVDAAFARGYLETHAEFAHGTYDIPRSAARLEGETYYGEAKYTLSPRIFVASRIERNSYPFVRPGSGGVWQARITDFVDGEAGVGYRLTASTLVKASYRVDRWWVPVAAPGFLGQGGHAVAMQVSQSFDVVNWFTRDR